MGTYNKIDLKFSREGDIELGQPKRGPDGEILKDENGKGIVDFMLTEGTGSLEQDIYNRIRTNQKEWELHKEIGANLEDIIGEPNTRKTAELGTKGIKKTLTFDNRIDKGDLSIRPVPTGHDEITYFLQVVDTQHVDPLIVPIPFNFIRGMLN